MGEASRSAAVAVIALALMAAAACAPFDPNEGAQEPATCRGADGGTIDAGKGDAACPATTYGEGYGT